MQRKVVYRFSAILFGTPLDNDNVGFAELQTCKKVLKYDTKDNDGHGISTENEGRNGANWE
jgi:hypothetical protein